MTLLLASLLAAAQAASPAAKPADTASGPAVCFVRKFKDARNKDHDFSVVVPSSLSTPLTEKGFKKAECGEVATRIKAYRDGVCKMAASGNGAVQERFEDVLGARPDHLCAAAKAIEGLTN
ncbi:hypothetical protein [Sphingomonas lenta]|uniref:UrcA family protein n=1 Tax=Sphingomonas lenta TaxID=1141887 RepID=A0A2A2SB38_9SPHN|nr:hypothetical protein [Sphingomonas lenta]PAX06400.1 hypothetical protein CKY28_17540 [Sphingomonas lenta]